VTGTITFDTSTVSGSATIDPFALLDETLDDPMFVATPMSLTGIGDGSGGSGTLVLGNAVYDWNGTYDIPLAIVWDAVGFFNAISAGIAGNTTITGGAAPASDNGDGAFDGGEVFATTTWNATNINPPVELGDNPSGTLPLVADTIGGSPIHSGPLTGASLNFDLMCVQITSCTNTDGAS
jgi:hypothetical protein